MHYNEVMAALEYNLDGLVGPTHHYAGLSWGNLASSAHRDELSNPRGAALEGLAKMKLAASLGVGQLVMPPQRRPHLDYLRQCGFTGDATQLLAQAERSQLPALSIACSAASMWTANAATVSPSSDTVDGRVHFTAANMANTRHRALEAKQTSAMLRRIFPDDNCFAHHDPLPAQADLADEGAANHMRLCASHGRPGVEIFVFGRGQHHPLAPARFPARQTYEASRAVASSHTLDITRTIFIQQHPDAIDGGVFHNDVIAVSNENVLLCHERAFVDQREVIAKLRSMYAETADDELIVIEVTQQQLSLENAVASYLFNSQIVTLPTGNMAIICPQHCMENSAARAVLETIQNDRANPVTQVCPAAVNQSMNNGGGPACLRLRIVLTEKESRHFHRGVIFTESLYDALCTCVQTHYRDALTRQDLADPQLMDEAARAVDAIETILGLQ